jgi:hypothetical protein
MSKDLEKLRCDKEYYGGVGKKYLSNSDIGALLKNPNDFGVSLPDNTNFAKGRLFHQLILEPKKARDFIQNNVISSGSRNTKVYKEQLIKQCKEVMLLKKEVDEIVSLTQTMLSNMDFFDLIREDNSLYEEPAIKKIKGIWWKGKADIVGSKFVIDLKTTSDINKFKWSAREYNYDSQAFIYEILFGKPLIFLVIDKKTGMLGKFIPTEDFLTRGEEKVEKAIDVYNTFFNPLLLKESKKNIKNHYITEEL